MNREQIESAIDGQRAKKADYERKIAACDRRLEELKQMLSVAKTEPLPLFQAKEKP